MSEDSGVHDAGPNDAGIDDAGLNDAGLDDAGLNDAGLNDAGLDDAGLNDAGLDDAGFNDAGFNDAGCDPTQIRWTSLPAHAGFDGLIPWMQVWRTDGGVMLTHRGAWVLLDEELREIRSGLFSTDGGYGGAFGVARRRDGFDVLTNDFPSGSSTWLHHLSQAGSEDRPVLQFENPDGGGPGQFRTRQVEGTSIVINFDPRIPSFSNHLFRWDEGATTLVLLHAPPEYWDITLIGDDQLVMNYSASQNGPTPPFTEFLGDGGVRTLALVGWPAEALEGQFVLPTFSFFSPGGPVQQRASLADAGFLPVTLWSGTFDAPLCLAGGPDGGHWVLEWNEGASIPLGTRVQSIDRFDDSTLVASRVNPDGTIDVGLLCDP